MTQPLLDDSYDYPLAKTRNTSEALRLIVGSVSELQKLYDDLGYAIYAELEAGRLLDRIKKRIETAGPVAESLDELEDSLRGEWSHFSCNGCCFRDTWPEMSEDERRAFVETNFHIVTKEQWRWHRNESGLSDSSRDLGFSLDELRNSLNKDSATRLKLWDEISEAVHDAFVWLFEQRTGKELASTEARWKREARLEELDKFLEEVVSHHRYRARCELGLEPKENSFWEMERLAKETEVMVQFAKEYLDRPWIQTPSLTGYFLVNVLDAQLAVNPVTELGRHKGRSFLISSAVVAGVVLAFIFGWKWIAWAGIVCLVLKWSFGLWVRYKFSRAAGSLGLIRDEVVSLGFDAEELIRRLRQVEEQWPYLPSIVYSLLRLGSASAMTHESAAKT